MILMCLKNNIMCKFIKKMFERKRRTMIMYGSPVKANSYSKKDFNLFLKK